MPKTSKKSKASKRTGLSKRFDLSNKKVQFFVVIGIVAVLGGGWFTYKSFAATNIGTANIANGNLNINASKPCTAKVITDTAKNNTKVASIYCPPNSGTAVAETKNFYHLSSSRLYRACATVRGSGKLDIRVGDSYAIQTINTESYQTHCTGFQKQNVSNTLDSQAQVLIDSYKQSGNALVNVSSVWVEEQTPTSPTPCSGKNC